MSTVVQATCPGCKNVLRIPAEWLQQPIRCKHCQTIIQARPPASPPPLAPTAAVKKPVPAARARPAVVPPKPTPVPAAVPRKALPPAGTVKVRPPRAPVALPAVAPRAPVALPVAPAALPIAGFAAEPGSAFADLDEATPTGRRRHSRGRGWAGFAVGLVVLAIVGGIIFVFWDQLKPYFGDKQEKKQEARVDPKTDKNADSSKLPRNPDTPADPNKDKIQPVEPDPTKDRKPDPNKDRKPDPNKDRKPDPNKDRKPDPNKDRKPDPNKDKNSKPPPVRGAFPRRALVISVHNYLYANPVNFGDPGAGNSLGHNFHTFLGRLSQFKGFRISPSQIVHLSDAARNPHPPVKEVIEKTLTDFLAQSRGQDHLLVLFAGHGVEIEGEAYLVPIDGELTNPKKLIPLKWVYQKLAACKARQKLFILDVCRLNPSKGLERPNGGPMGAKFDLALKNPPKGVQVWTACTAGQQSYEFEHDRLNNGLFVDALYEAADKGVDGVIQKPNDPFPVKLMVERVNKRLKDELEPQKLVQTSRLSGDEVEGGPSYNPDEPMPPKPVVASQGLDKGRADPRSVRLVLKELSVPPVKKSQSEGLISFGALPPFPAKALEAYPVDNTPSPLRDAIEHTQAVLWALSPNVPPPELAEAVGKIKASGEIKGDLSGLRESYRAPGGGNAEKNLKNQIEMEGRRVASFIRLLEDEQKSMEKAKAMRAKASKRWQANYDFMLARLESQLAYIYEYSTMLGQMRKEFPPRDPAVHGGWRLASRERLQGDATGRKLYRDAQKILDTLAAQNPDTPWEVLAKREKMTALGLEWKPEK